ncbi:hypothetical protein ATANTOWER_004358 [Ataeniobius toweri]|uniref:Uncharacterized protein n=1 Tax=Ataeniobius toweri TaxID=208326 RepID=A0ABU7ANX1_9TELE|nr:hypothetical protein [Ataeniobius toweri]
MPYTTAERTGDLILIQQTVTDSLHVEEEQQKVTVKESGFSGLFSQGLKASLLLENLVERKSMVEKGAQVTGISLSLELHFNFQRNITIKINGKKHFKYITV